MQPLIVELKKLIKIMGKLEAAHAKNPKAVVRCSRITKKALTIQKRTDRVIELLSKGWFYDPNAC